MLFLLIKKKENVQVLAKGNIHNMKEQIKKSAKGRAEQV